MEKAFTPKINLTQAQQITRHKSSLIPSKITWLITGFLFGATVGWCGAWIAISYIKG